MNVPPWYLQTPAGKVWLAEQASAREVERRNLLERIKSLDAEREKSAPAVAKKATDARDKLQAAREAVKKAELAYSLALSVSHGAGACYDHQRGALLAQVRGMRPEVTAFIGEMRNLLQATIATSVTVEPYPDGTYANRMLAATNHKSHLARVNAIQAALRGAESLYLADPAEDLTERFVALRNAIPEIGSPQVEAVTV